MSDYGRSMQLLVISGTIANKCRSSLAHVVATCRDQTDVGAKAKACPLLPLPHLRRPPTSRASIASFSAQHPLSPSPPFTPFPPSPPPSLPFSARLPRQDQFRKYLGAFAIAVKQNLQAKCSEEAFAGFLTHDEFEALGEKTTPLPIAMWLQRDIARLCEDGIIPMSSIVTLGEAVSQVGG